MSHIFGMGSFILGIRMGYDDPLDAYLPITRQRKVAEVPKLAEGNIVHATGDFCTSSKVKRSAVKVTRPFNAVTENQPYHQNGEACKLPLARGGDCGCRTTRLHSLLVLRTHTHTHTYTHTHTHTHTERERERERETRPETDEDEAQQDGDYIVVVLYSASN